MLYLKDTHIPIDIATEKNINMDDCGFAACCIPPATFTWHFSPHSLFLPWVSLVFLLTTNNPKNEMHLIEMFSSRSLLLLLLLSFVIIVQFVVVVVVVVHRHHHQRSFTFSKDISIK